MTATQNNGNRPLISLRDVGVAYRIRKGLFSRKLFWALKDISFDLYRGDSLGIVGRNGSGKSTLLRILAGVMAPDKGIIHDDGLRVSLLSLGVGFANHLSGRENAILSGMFLGMKKSEIESKLDEIIAFAELDEFIDEHVSTYSTGMRARLAFAVAFQINPDVLLVDEVTGVGDAQFREKSMAIMKERLQHSNSTVVFVSHSASNVRQLCDRVIWIEKGEMRAEGETSAVLSKYKRFLGL